MQGKMLARQVANNKKSKTLGQKSIADVNLANKNNNALDTNAYKTDLTKSINQILPLFEKPSSHEDLDKKKTERNDHLDVMTNERVVQHPNIRALKTPANIEDVKLTEMTDSVMSKNNEKIEIDQLIENKKGLTIDIRPHKIKHAEGEVASPNRVVEGHSHHHKSKYY